MPAETFGANTPVTDVVGAVILRDGKVFCAQRAAGGAAGNKWEFPGGKVEPGETPESALVRELREELGVGATLGPQFTTTEVSGEDGTPVRLTTFIATIPADAEISLVEHQRAVWLAPYELGTLDWAAADRPTVDLLAKAYAAGRNVSAGPTITF